MENFKIQYDIPIFCIQAASFPSGVKDAHEQLHSLVPFNKERNYFGISSPNENGEIIYKAAITELTKDELAQFQLEKFTIPKGDYLCEEIEIFMENVSVIGATFQKMIQNPDIDPSGFCLEWYISDNSVRCMVKLK